jgi:drug/metabolite transporter (DMT)-like permease
MSNFVFYTLSLLSGVIYAIGGMGIKAAMRNGAGPIRSIFMTNVMYALCFAPFFFFSDEFPPKLLELWKPLLTGLFLFLGQVLVVITIRIGDVTIQTPLMGIKILLVASLTALFGLQDLNSCIWGAALLSSIAIFILGASGFRNRRKIALTALFAFFACLAFAIADILIQTWAPEYNRYNFAAIMNCCLPIYGLLLIPFFREQPFDITFKAAKWLFFGTLMLGLQSVLFVIPIAFRGEATIVNILYSSRGLWSIVLVWLIGKHFDITESNLKPRIILQRFFGALLLVMSIYIILE